MSDDIVTRLREHWEDETMLGNDLLAEALKWAIDEIELLKAQLDGLRDITDKLYKHLSADFCWHCGCENSRYIDASNALDEFRGYMMGSERRD